MQRRTPPGRAQSSRTLHMHGRRLGRPPLRLWRHTGASHHRHAIAADRAVAGRIAVLVARVWSISMHASWVAVLPNQDWPRRAVGVT